MKVVFLRHGESEWNKENRFTGWTDVDLSEQGIAEAKKAGQFLKKEGFTFDLAFTSLQKRAIRTLWLTLDEMNLMWIPIRTSWRLNERHYGALQGLNKSDVREKYGEEQFMLWRRSFDVPPPPLKDDPIQKDPRYKDIRVPKTECLKDVIARALPYWEKEIVPEVKKGRKVIVSAHGNSLRALVMHLNKMTKEEIVEYNIPTGIPLVYEFDSKMKPIKHYYLGDPEDVKRAMEKVASQGKQKKS